MFQRRPHRTARRSRSLALGGALAALAVVGGGTVVAVGSPDGVEDPGIQLTQNAAAQGAAQELALGTAVNLDLEPVVARAAGGTIPSGTAVQVTGLPDGLTQDGWVISGTPTRTGEYDVLVTVSNSGVSRSQRVTIAVVDSTGDPAEASAPSADAEESAQVEPQLSAVPGERARGGAATAADDDNDDDSSNDAGGGDGSGADSGVGTSPDLCSVLGDGQFDGASVAQLLPALGGEGADADAAAGGLVMVLVNAVVGLLPSVLGEDGLLGELGSAGEMLCTLAPDLLGGPGAEGDALEGGAGVGATTQSPSVSQLQGAAAALPMEPAALLGLLTTGAGSLGQ